MINRKLAAMVAILLPAMLAGASHASDKAYGGYLTPGEFDVTSVLEPAPRRGDPRYDADRKIFRETRRMAGSPRWALATNDVDMSPAALLRDFSCAVGVELTPENAPGFSPWFAGRASTRRNRAASPRRRSGARVPSRSTRAPSASRSRSCTTARRSG